MTEEQKIEPVSEFEALRQKAIARCKVIKEDRLKSFHDQRWKSYYEGSLAELMDFFGIRTEDFS